MTSAAAERRVERDLIYALYANAPAVVAVGVAVGAMVLAATWGSVPPAVLWGWVAVLVATQVARIWLVVAFRKEKPPEGPRIGIWAWRYALLLAATGATYGSTAIVMFPDATPLGQTVLMIVLGTLAASSITGYAYHPPGMALFILTCMLPLIGRLALEDSLGYKVLAFAFAFQAVTILAVFGRVQAATLRRSVVFGHENAALVEELRVKTSLAEAAQRNAERASLAKSEFFAAASHDLRQPMQALGLYAASLRELKREPEDARKIDQILSSVDALESLFDELLDISKLDAGHVEPVPSHFAARALFERLEAAYAPIARRSNLALQFRPGDLVLRTDAVLLERVLGNLIANGLRYTEAGGVTVSCERRGERAVVAVEDTGIGIPESEREKIFDEFYQLENPERDRRKGLGLGLATVRRITRLLGIPLTLESEVGRGSRFVLEVPLGDPARVAEIAAQPRTADLDALAGRRVLVIEDEASVREGLVELLRDWRCEPVAAAAAAEALQLLSQPPDAVIADYRLRDGRNGIDAIDEVRRRFDAALPAILVTGDTAPEIFMAARAHALPLLTKPVRAARLRAALAHLLSQSREAARTSA
jgi:signal transduction histidine kinase/ActR/RegA family two-component response regulator